MATLTQAPGTLNLEFIRGDDFTFTLNFDISLVGYYFTAQSVYSNAQGTKSIPITVSAPTTGTALITLDDTETALFPIGVHTWLVKWWAIGSTVMRTILSGTITAS